MTDRLAAAHELGREWGKRTGEPHPLTATVRDCLFFAGFPTDISHRNAFRDGAKGGADGTDNLNRRRKGAHGTSRAGVAGTTP